MGVCTGVEAIVTGQPAEKPRKTGAGAGAGCGCGCGVTAVARWDHEDGIEVVAWA